MKEDPVKRIRDVRTSRPEQVLEAARTRRRRERLVSADRKMLIVAADHPARGALRVGSQELAMADRGDFLDRLCVTLTRSEVDGVLGSADVIEELMILGALDGKLIFGSMNRGGLAGASFEIDDRFTAYDAESIKAMGLNGGKMLFRIDPADSATVATMEACARAVNALAGNGLIAMIEPFMSHRVEGRTVNDLSTAATIRAVTVASGLGSTSAYTWLKVPVVDDMERVLAASTLPTLLLGGEVRQDQDVTFAAWDKGLRLAPVLGLVVGRSLLYPPDGDVEAAIDTAVSLL